MLSSWVFLSRLNFGVIYMAIFQTLCYMPNMVGGEIKMFDTLYIHVHTFTSSDSMQSTTIYE